jgi:hypothetical protein
VGRCVLYTRDRNYVSASVVADGTYTAQIRPGGIRASFAMSGPYCFTDSPEAPLAGIDNSYSWRQAWSDEFTVSAGGEAVVDAAVVTC